MAGSGFLMPILELSKTCSNKRITSATAAVFSCTSSPLTMPTPAPLLTLLVMQASRNPCAFSSCKSATISGRISPANNASTSRPRTSCPRPRASCKKALSNAAASISLRSKRAQALSSGLLALMVRIKSRGSAWAAS